MKNKILHVGAWVSAREFQNPKHPLKSGQLFSRGQTIDKNNSDKLQHQEDSEFCLRNTQKCSLCVNRTDPTQKSQRSWPGAQTLLWDSSKTEAGSNMGWNEDRCSTTRAGG